MRNLSSLHLSQIAGLLAGIAIVSISPESRPLRSRMRQASPGWPFRPAAW